MMTDEDDELDIDKMFEIHYKITELFENNKIDILDINLPKENNFGFIEYKRTLTTYKKRISKLKTQIYWRLSEGLTYNSQNICYYIIGIDDNGSIKHPITDDEIIITLDIINNCINNSDIKYLYKKIIYNNHQLLIIKFWKEEILTTNDIKIILLGPAKSGKTKFFIDLHVCKLFSNNKKYPSNNIAKSNNIVKSNIFDIHNDEKKINKTLVIHHQYSNVEYKKDINLIDIDNLEDINDNLDIVEGQGIKIHIIDTPSNSIISNIKYLISYNIDIIIYFDNINNIFDNILEEINKKYNNVIKISDTTYLEDFNTKKLLHLIMLKSQFRKKILSDINDIIIVNETRFIQSHQETKFNKYIYFVETLMDINIFDNITDINIRNIQYIYNYKSSICANNTISIETDKIIQHLILGKTKELKILDLTNKINIDNYENNIITYYIIILNQIYIITDKKNLLKIIFDKTILIPENYLLLPVFIIWCKNNIYHLEIIFI